MLKRPFLFGLGVGVMAGAALLQLLLIGEHAPQRMEPAAGPAAKTPLYTQAELDLRLAEERSRVLEELKRQNAGQQAAADAKTEAQAETAKDAAGALQSQDADQARSNRAGAADPSKRGTGLSRTPQQTASKRVIVRIPPNASLDEAAGLLAAKHVVSDKKAFIDRMQDGSGKIRAGYFAFEGSPGIAEVVKIVTGKPLPPDEAQAEMNRAEAGK
ncbi:hypothetical protein [Paenibacillus humicola]|uniref:hypothetical protein n=1 Tax=Paenibacillus humicola TaxID=3110540 RepID=UPI00237BF2AD|nr:hypothetical protein [Paenibacillus humicola]